MPDTAAYLQMITSAYEWEKGRVEEERQKALQHIAQATPLFGYVAPRWMLDFAATCAFLYARRDEPELARQACQALLFYREWLNHLPPEAAGQRPEYEEGIPPLEPVFHPVLFASAVQQIRPALSPGELDSLASILADSLRPIWRFPEWGGHNRAMLRAAGLAVSAATFPDHPEANWWISLADELAEESWGRWSIEDAMLYQPHWLRALIRYAEARGRTAEFIDMVQPRLHLKAMTQLLSPLGILPDFGDSHWLMHSQWEWLVCLEWGARVYHNPAMKWAANRIYDSRQGDQPQAYLATVAMLGWEWCDESVFEHPPLNRDDALDDLVIKKLVWRTGWGPQATYACLNYRDEGDYARVARDYLRTTLAVSAEKMHHGHADEGSFTMLVHRGTLLLHESGYRESPPDGIYRSAAYHNRLVWKAGSCPEGLRLIEFLRGDGRYQPTRTERLYQTRLGDLQFHRVRVTDEQEGLSWDRSVIFISELPCWIVVDSALALRTRLRTLSTLWWTTDFLAQRENWFDTYLHGVQGWTNRREAALWLGLPPAPHQVSHVSVEPFRRSFQDEIALARTWCGEHFVGQYVNFVTVLWPHPYADQDLSRAEAVEIIRSDPPGRGIGIWLRWQDKVRLFGVLNDLALGGGTELLFHDVRPTYTTDMGLARYGPLASDAAFCALRRETSEEWAGFINGTFLADRERILYQGQSLAMFQEDRTARPGVPKRFRWETTL